MAEVMRCQRGFVTKVLSGRADLSLEQTERLNTILGHSSEEAIYFLLLVQYARAGSSGLREHVRNQMKEILNRRLKAEKEMESRNILSPEDHMQYYSAWYYAAIRVAVSIPELQTKEALVRRLNLPLATVVSALDFLVSRGLVERKGDRFLHRKQQQILLSSDHPMVKKHHVNWRVRALSALDREGSKDLHYSYVVTISENDSLQLRSFLVESIQEFLRRAAPSKEEAIYSFCLDFFEL